MAKKLTCIEVLNKYKEGMPQPVNIDEYKNTETKIRHICPLCQKLFYTTPHSVWKSNTTSCGCKRGKTNTMSQSDAENKSIKTGFKMIGKYINSFTITNFECPICYKSFKCIPNSIWYNAVKCCGCVTRRRNISQIEARQLTIQSGIKMLGKYINCKTKTAFECPICKKEFYVKPQNIWYRKVKSCQNCGRKHSILSRTFTQQKAEEKSLAVGIKMIGKYIKDAVKTQFECPNCKKTFLCKPNYIWQRHTQSCGNCQLKRNGQTTSRYSLSLQKLLPKNFEHNIFFGKPHPKTKSQKCIDWTGIYNG